MKVKNIIFEEEYEDYLCSSDGSFGLRWVRILFHGGYELSTRFVRYDALPVILEEEPHYLFDFIAVKDVSNQTIEATIKAIEKNALFSNVSQIYASPDKKVTRKVTGENFNCLDDIHIEDLNDNGLLLTINVFSQGMHYIFEFEKYIHYRTTFGKKMSKYYDRPKEHVCVKENSHIISDFVGILSGEEAYKHFQLKDSAKLVEVIYTGEYLIYQTPEPRITSI